jgi:hypothetical protein
MLTVPWSCRFLPWSRRETPAVEQDQSGVVKNHSGVVEGVLFIEVPLGSRRIIPGSYRITIQNHPRVAENYCAVAEARHRCSPSSKNNQFGVVKDHCRVVGDQPEVERLNLESYRFSPELQMITLESQRITLES